MSTRDIELRHLLNRRVRDADGQVIGRLEELRAEIAADDPRQYEIHEFHLGAYALFEALAGGYFGRALARLLGRGRYRRYVIPWDWMDLSDPQRPRVTRRKAELPDTE